MPQVIALKFSQEEMPLSFDPGPLEDVQIQDFVLAPRASGTDVGFVAGIEWVSRQQATLRRAPLPKLVRKATDDEKEAFFVRKALERKALMLCKEKSREAGLPIKISTARIDPNDGRVIFQFTSDQRVDFRQLVRDMAAIMHARIELWQIGVRDEAKLVDGLGICGLQTCCSSWLTEFKPISIRMAKHQDINLPPVKLSGQCGRLLCCLSYEVDQYREMARGMFPKGATIKTGGKNGIIADRNIIRQSYHVAFEDGTMATILRDQIDDAKVPEQMKRMGSMFDTRTPTEDESVAEDEPVPQSDSAIVAPPPIRTFEARTEPLPASPAPATESDRRSRRPNRGGSGNEDRRPGREGRRGHRDHRERSNQNAAETPRPPAGDAVPADDNSPSGQAESPENREQRGRRRGRRRGRGRGRD